MTAASSTATEMSPPAASNCIDKPSPRRRGSSLFSRSASALVVVVDLCWRRRRTGAADVDGDAGFLGKSLDRLLHLALAALGDRARGDLGRQRVLGGALAIDGGQQRVFEPLPFGAKRVLRPLNRGQRIVGSLGGLGEGGFELDQASGVGGLRAPRSAGRGWRRARLCERLRRPRPPHARPGRSRWPIQAARRALCRARSSAHASCAPFWAASSSAAAIASARRACSVSDPLSASRSAPVSVL